MSPAARPHSWIARCAAESGSRYRVAPFGEVLLEVLGQLALLALGSLPRSVCLATLDRKGAVAASCSGAQVLGQLLALGLATSCGRAGSSLTNRNLRRFSGWGGAVALVPLLLSSPNRFR